MATKLEGGGGKALVAGPIKKDLCLWLRKGGDDFSYFYITVIIPFKKLNITKLNMFIST